MFLASCFSEASLPQSWGGGGDVQRGVKTTVTNPQTNLTSVKLDQNLANHGDLTTALLCEALKYTCGEFPLLSLYFHENTFKKFIYKNPEAGTVYI